jgi:hypothetical protein
MAWICQLGTVFKNSFEEIFFDNLLVIHSLVEAFLFLHADFVLIFLEENASTADFDQQFNGTSEEWKQHSIKAPQ